MFVCLFVFVFVFFQKGFNLLFKMVFVLLTANILFGLFSVNFNEYYFRLKKNKSCVSKLPRAFVFRSVFDSAKFKVWIFFACLIFWLIFFPSFFMNFLVKIYKKRYDRHNEALWTTDFFNSVFCLVSCSSKIKFHISKLWPTQIWHVCYSEKKKKKTLKTTAFRSGLSICHELWDIAFIFLPL